MDFDPKQHEEYVFERYRLADERKHRIEAFDFLVDMALDGQITLAEALNQYRAEEILPQTEKLL